MAIIIVLLCCGMGAGRLWLLLTHRRASLAEAALTYVVWAMLAAFGMRIGADDSIMSRLHVLGLQALILGVIAAAAATVAVALAMGRRGRTAPEASGAVHTGGINFKALRGSAITLGAFALGLASTATGIIGIDSALAERIATWSLFCLIALVGLATGSNPDLGKTLRRVSAAILLIPVVGAAATLAAGALAGLLLGMGAGEGTAAVSGMGYYSLSSMIISEACVEALGAGEAMALAAIALMANIVREVTALVVIPLVGRVAGLGGSTAMCGVTSLDVTLPTLVSTFGAEAVAPALVNGIILELTTPLIVMGVCSLL